MGPADVDGETQGLHMYVSLLTDVGYVDKQRTISDMHNQIAIYRN